MFSITTIGCNKDEKDDTEPPINNNDDNGGGGGGSTSCPATFTDSRDNNVYQTIEIGGQCWMAENLKYLPSVVSSSQRSPSTPYYYVYGYYSTDVDAAKDTDNYDIYGVLYNWPAAKNACPTEWKLPSDADWKKLEMALNMTQDQADETEFRGTNEGSKLAGNVSLWYNGDLKNNSQFGTSNFNALPGDHLSGYGHFNSISYYGYWWSSSDASDATDIRAWSRELSFSTPQIKRTNSLAQLGYSVRCIKN